MRQNLGTINNTNMAAMRIREMEEIFHIGS